MSAPEAGDAPQAADIRALRWIAPGVDQVKALTTRPVACEKDDYDLFVISTMAQVSDVGKVPIGRMAFESPALLGGAAGRMGLSCSSCHLNGRDNPDFFVEGVSDKPGTADVTSSMFSKVRGDDNFNPVPIPDLAARDGKQIKDRRSEALRQKVHGLVVEEFDGQEPAAGVFEALLAYLDVLDMGQCANPTEHVKVDAGRDASDAWLAVIAANDFLRAGKTADALLMARVSRSVLERMHERFVARDQADVREALVSASRAVETWADGVRSGSVSEAPVEQVKAAADMVRKGAGESLYSPEVLRAALAR